MDVLAHKESMQHTGTVLVHCRTRGGMTSTVLEFAAVRMIRTMKVQYLPEGTSDIVHETDNKLTSALTVYECAMGSVLFVHDTRRKPRVIIGLRHERREVAMPT